MSKKLFNKILVSNRGEIAVRVINACRLLGIPTLAIYSTADKNAVHAQLADEAVEIGPPPPRESYLNIDKIIETALEYKCDAIHPGYGFLAENPEFPEKCKKAGITFIGPSAESMRLMGNKVQSRIKMADAGVPLIPGMKAAGTSIAEFEKAAEEAGYPVLIKAAAGGGGKGMRIVHHKKNLKESVEAAKREAKNAFNDDTVYLEKYIEDPRHIEFQVLADKHGDVIHIFERECSIQRRHQKIIEETPSVAVTPEIRAKMGEMAVKVTKAANYLNAGTIEFLLDKNGGFYFLEMNTRVQVEHPVTEMTTGVDLVVEQIRIAAGEKISDSARNAKQSGHSIECRVYAEDAENGFLPSSGKILQYIEPAGPGIRVDTGIANGTTVGVEYDPILAKLIVHAPDASYQRSLNLFKTLIREYPESAFITQAKIWISILERTIEKELVELAAAVSSAALMSKPSVSTGAGVKQMRPLPWQTIGTWEIGMGISK